MPPCFTVLLLLTRINGHPQNTTMKGHSQHNPSLIGRKNQAKFENDCVSTNGHRIKITQSNLMILVSFSSAGVAWFEDVKRYGTFRSQATENLPFRFLWAPGITPHLVPPIRPDYFQLCTWNFESGLTPQIVWTLRPCLGAGLTPQLQYHPPTDSEVVVLK